MGAELVALRFEAKAKNGGLISFLPDGKTVFLDRDCPHAVASGEVWACRVDRRGTVAFASPVARAETAPGPPGLDWNEVREAEERLRKEVGAALAHALEDARKERAPADAALEELRREVAALRERRPEPPAAADASRGLPTPAEVRLLILRTLHARSYWGGRVMSGEHFVHGLLSTAEGPVVRDALQELVREGLVLGDGVGSGARYSLNPARSRDIQAIVSPPSPPARPTPEPAPVDWTSKDARFVERGEFENVLRNLRGEIDVVRREAGSAAEGSSAHLQVEALERRLRDVEGRTRGADGAFTKITARVEALEARPAHPPAAAHAPSRRDGDDERLHKILESGIANLGVPQPDDAVALAAALGGDPLLGKAVRFLDRMDHAGLAVGPPAAYFGVGALGRCVATGCSEQAADCCPVFNLSRPERPQVCPGLVCQAHAARPPIVVWVDGPLNRKTAEVAVSLLVVGLRRLGVASPVSCSSRHIQLVAAPETRRAWDIAARRRPPG